MFWHVSLHVERKVVRPRETSLTNFAFEGLGTCVFPVVASQLIRPENEKNKESLLVEM